jgi:uncharacterized membrane protein YfcA
MPLWFGALAILISFVAGATASVVGFGIGSLLTPVLAARFGADVAIAAVALPHLAGGLLRGWRLRQSVDRPVLVRFGLLSATGGLIGALLFARLAPAALNRTLGALLILTATAGVSGWSERWRPQGALVWVLGGLSGLFGGAAGNQGGLRAAALSAFGLAPTVFVATSTAIGVLIDLVRMPIYLHRAGERMVELWGLIALTIGGVLAGTLVGERLLFGLSRARFRVVVSVAIGLLGLRFVLGPA